MQNHGDGENGFFPAPAAFFFPTLACVLYNICVVSISGMNWNRKGQEKIHFPRPRGSFRTGSENAGYT